MLDFAENFRHQFVNLYPSRPSLLLFPPNECQVPKFISTTVRPSQLEYKALHDYKDAAEFVADHVVYEPLTEPTRLPRIVPSPEAVLRWQRGDCVDMAMVLTSILVGGGYDAYVVIGRARRAVCLNDMSYTDCPLLAEAKGTPAKPARVPSDKYVISDRPDMTSKYVARTRLREQNKIAFAERRRLQEAMDANPELYIKEPTSDDEEEPEEPEDELEGKRVHAWVLVRKGRRDVADHFFLEPSTGRRYAYPPRLNEEGEPIEGHDPLCPYYQIEMIYNHKNVWINMQPQTANGLRDVTYDIHNAAKWEYVLIDSGDTRDAEGTQEGGENGGLGDILGQSTLQHTGKPDHQQQQQGGGGGGGAAAAAAAAVGGQDAAGGAVSSPRLGGASGPGQGQQNQQLGPDGHILDPPPSWVRKLDISKEAFLRRAPQGHTSTLYKKCRMETWSSYTRPDGLVLRLTVYKDYARRKELRVQEGFEFRHDKLVQRWTYPLEGRVRDMFDPGRPEALKEITTERGRRAVYEYYNTRLDGLYRREQVLGKKTMEHFFGRRDRLVYRSVTYDTPAAATAGSQAVRLEALDATEMTAIKMTQKFARNEAVSAHADIAKRVFALQTGMITVHFHLETRRITFSTRNFTKDGMSSSDIVDPFVAEPRKSELLEEFNAYVAAERECNNAVREAERDIQATLTLRKDEQDNLTLDTTIYDTLRNHAKDASRGEAARAEAGDGAGLTGERDYLAPYLRQFPKDTQLTREMALQVKNACLRALKERLIERANIIQQRLDEANAELVRRQTAYSRKQDHIDKNEEEEYMRFVHESQFTIQILMQRRKRHEDLAVQKYIDLDGKLRIDPRLAILGR